MEHVRQTGAWSTRARRVRAQGQGPMFGPKCSGPGARTIHPIQSKGFVSTWTRTIRPIQKKRKSFFLAANLTFFLYIHLQSPWEFVVWGSSREAFASFKIPWEFVAWRSCRLQNPTTTIALERLHGAQLPQITNSQGILKLTKALRLLRQMTNSQGLCKQM